MSLGNRWTSVRERLSKVPISTHILTGFCGQQSGGSRRWISNPYLYMARTRIRLPNKVCGALIRSQYETSSAEDAVP
jgi:hypothetical protein